MKTLRKLCTVFVLTLTLALSAFAGEISTGITSPPPPAQATTGEISTGYAGEMTTGVTGDMSAGIAATDPATEFVLNLLQSLLSLF